MIKTLKQTIQNMFYWIKKKLIQFKKWLVILIFGAAVLAAPLILPPVPDIALENIQADYNVSQIKDKYRLEKTAFILDAVDENAIQTEVGNKNSDEFLPELTLRKWDDEVSFKVKYKHNVKKDKQKVDIENLKIKWKGEKTEVHYYDLKKGEMLIGEELEHDVFEVEVILLEKPDTNIVEFDIETKGLAFYYQPELTQKEKDEGAFRPENVVGSYAVYHESKAGDYSKMGLKNYRAGKAFHIYRPKIIDSAGTEVWGKLNITDNLLTVEIPQEFLDNAVYPVIVDPTFGCDPADPGTSHTGIGDKIYGIVDNPGQSGIANSITASFMESPSNVKAALYIDSNGSLVSPQSEERSNPGTGWQVFDITNGPTISAQDYIIVVFADSGRLYCDTAGGSSKYASETYNSWPATASFSGVAYKYAVYCTYTAGGAAERRMFLTQ